MEGVHAVLADNTFSLPSGPASCARKIAESISMWIPDHLEGTTTFEKKLTASLTTCLQVRHSSQKVRRERMWSAYHELRTSDQDTSEWNTFLQQSGNSDQSPIFCQYVGHFIFKKLIRYIIMWLNHLNPRQEIHASRTKRQMQYGMLLGGLREH